MTDEEMEIRTLFREKYREMAPEDYKDSPDTMIFTCDNKGRICEIIVKSRYEPVRLTFEHLETLSKILGTKHIDVEDQRSGGCESCDWGSNYGVNISVWYDE